MRIYSVVSAAVSGILMVGVSTTALAGSFNANVMPYEGVPSVSVRNENIRSATCNTQIGVRPTQATNCNAGVVMHPGAVDTLAPVNSYSAAPYGYLKRFAYKNTPNVNIMRVHTRGQMAALNDVPAGFRGGCTPASTGYCRAGGAMSAPIMRLVPRVMPRPVMVQAPVMRAPVIRPPVMLPPVMRVPVAPVQVRTGRGYNPANFAPRQYGNNVLTPGIAHIPTSIVDRSPITHIGGVAQQRVSSVTTLNGTYGQGFTGSRPVAPRPSMAPRQMGGNVIGHVSGGSYTYTTPGTPDYWEKTSGATVVDGLPATQVLCRRTGTAGASRTVNVVRPVIGVPRAVPVPVRVPVAVSPVCNQAPRPIAQRPMLQRPMPQRSIAGSRWTY